MKNIVDTTIELLNNSEKGALTVPQIKKELKHLKIDNIETHIYSDLLNDGRFIFTNNKWSLKESFTMKEIVKEHYKSLGDKEILIEDAPIEEEETITINTIKDDETQEIDLNAIDDIDDVTSFVDFDTEEVEDEL